MRVNGNGHAMHAAASQQKHKHIHRTTTSLSSHIFHTTIVLYNLENCFVVIIDDNDNDNVDDDDDDKKLLFHPYPKSNHTFETTHRADTHIHSYPTYKLRTTKHNLTVHFFTIYVVCVLSFSCSRVRTADNHLVVRAAYFYFFFSVPSCVVLPHFIFMSSGSSMNNDKAQAQICALFVLL